MIDLLRAIFATNGLTGIIILLSLLANLALSWFLWNTRKNQSTQLPVKIETVKIDDTQLEKILVENFTEQITRIEDLLVSVKKEIEMFTFSEHQPLREMLIKITASIELLAKTIEFAAKVKDKDK